MTKNDRNHVEEVHVVGFILCYQVPNLPEALDPFLHAFATGHIQRVFFPRISKVEAVFSIIYISLYCSSVFYQAVCISCIQTFLDSRTYHTHTHQDDLLSSIEVIHTLSALR